MILASEVIHGRHEALWKHIMETLQDLIQDANASNGSGSDLVEQLERLHAESRNRLASLRAEVSNVEKVVKGIEQVLDGLRDTERSAIGEGESDPARYSGGGWSLARIAADLAQRHSLTDFSISELVKMAQREGYKFEGDDPKNAMYSAIYRRNKAAEKNGRKRPFVATEHGRWKYTGQDLY